MHPHIEQHHHLSRASRRPSHAREGITPFLYVEKEDREWMSGQMEKVGLSQEMGKRDMVGFHLFFFSLSASTASCGLPEAILFLIN
jgi:hypothetical protein